MFLWVISLKTHSILYKIFLNESFDKSLSYVNSFVNSYCVLNSKLIWNRGTILSEDVLTASNL
jgi:hypothetical protein